MDVHSVEICESPSRADHMRLSATVSYETERAPGAGSAPPKGHAEEENIWFEVHRDFGAMLTTTGNPWLACLSPLAATLGESLRIDAPVDLILLENVRELLRIWRTWYPHLLESEIHAPTIRGAASLESRTASFFSGGVDSFFTVLRHDAGHGTPRSMGIDDLLFIRGFDLPRSNRTALDTVSDRLGTVADALGKRLVVVEMNLRETRFAEANWSGLTHAAALAAAGLTLERGYGTLLIPSSAGYRDLRSWGSHPLTDPLFSTSGTDVLHDGPAFMRVEKTEYVTGSEVALAALRVCWKSETGDNCGHCNNCYRTMLTLELLGALDRCATFDRGDLDLRQARRIYCSRSFDVRQFGYIRDLAETRGRSDIASAIRASLRGSARLTDRITRVRALRDRRVAWRWVPGLERWMLRRWVQ